MKDNKISSALFFSISIFISTLCVSLLINSCTKKKEDSTKDSGYSGIAAQALTDINTVEENYTPDSLKSNSTAATASLKNFSSTNVCADYDLFSCQPILVKLYIDIGKQYLGLMNKLLAGLSVLIQNVEDGKSGTITSSDLTVDYSKTSASVFSILGKNTSSSQSYIYFSSNTNNYQLSMDFSQIPTSQRKADTPNQGKIDVTLSYTDPTHWLITITGVGFECNDDNPTAPSQLKIVMHMNDQLWIGKSMLYNGHWIMTDNSSPTCATTESDDISANIYTEYIADKVAAKSNVYLMKRNVGTSDFPSQSNYYALNNICNSYSTNIASKGGNAVTCDVVANIWTSNKIATYQNPFCSTAADSTTALWNNTCSETSTQVSTASFDDTQVQWVSPNTFYSNTTITLPAAL